MSAVSKLNVPTNLHVTTNELLALSGRINEISSEISGLENRNELIVSGIPYLKDENLTSYFNAMWKHVGLREDSIPCGDIRRLKPSTKGDSLVRIEFALRNNRDDFYSNYLRLRDLQLYHLGIDSPRRVYVNENLAVDARRIKAAALRLKKNWKAVICVHLAGKCLRKTYERAPT